jgi:hypothetical protein
MCLWQSKYILTVLGCMLINHNFIFPPRGDLGTRSAQRERKCNKHIFSLTSATAGLQQDGLVAKMAWLGSLQGLAFERVLLQLSRLKHTDTHTDEN